MTQPVAGYRSLAEMRARLGRMLIEEGRLNASDLQDLQQRAAWNKEPLEHALQREHILTEEEVLHRFARLTQIPVLQGRQLQIDETAVAAVPPRTVVRYRVMPLHFAGDAVVLATDHLRDSEEESELRVLLGRPVQWTLCTARELTEFITHFYGIGLETFLNLTASEASARRSAGDEAAGVPDLVDEIIRDAIKSNATDIHVEPDEDRLRIRYRIDGVLYPARLPRGIERYQRALISSIKVMAQLDISERRLPQDGRFEKELDDQSFDVRVSVLPIHQGETIELRLLNRGATFLRMEELGLPPAQREQMDTLVRMPYGLVLFTGPTGSGKTTSLYAGLAEVNDTGLKIITIEDPVEYRIHGITQLQTQQHIGFTFAHGLRSILRHDPDLILVGEIRDDETADIAVSAALTGHLVLSTLHTNDSVGAATRLIDMGIAPYLVASSLQGIVAQRLIRKTCEHCREPVAFDHTYEEEIDAFFPDRRTPLEMWQGRGCPYCRFTGYRGRCAIYEILELNDELRSLIVERRSSSLLMQRAIAHGLTPLRRSAWEQVLAGTTTLAELLRVTSHARRRDQA